MKDKIKYFIYGLVVALCVTWLFNPSVKLQASSSLQSIGKIIINNPQTGQQEVVFDPEDQTKLKNSIIANAIEIDNLKEFVERQNEVNSELSDKSSELETEIDELSDSLGGFTPVIDSNGKIIGYKTEAGADIVFPFKSDTIYYLGEGTSFDISSYSGYEDFTVDNFIISRKDNYDGKKTFSGTLTCSTGGSRYANLYVTKSYDEGTGILTAYYKVKGGVAGSNIGSYPVTTSEIPVHAYLIIGELETAPVIRNSDIITLGGHVVNSTSGTGYGIYYKIPDNAKTISWVVIEGPSDNVRIYDGIGSDAVMIKNVVSESTFDAEPYTGKYFRVFAASKLVVELEVIY